MYNMTLIPRSSSSKYVVVTTHHACDNTMRPTRTISFMADAQSANRMLADTPWSNNQIMTIAEWEAM